MPVIDGEKYACSSCIKGHRVSGCTHSDRELHHINPKGRPVKQCDHCRGARKSKSHHAKCDCGEKKDKDKPKDKGDAKVHDTCSCHSGTKCVCGVKDNLDSDLTLDTGKQTLHATRTKPKLTTTQSESTLTVFTNGHHKPCHRNNNTAHNSGTPYKIPRPHTLHGHAAFAQLSPYNSGEGSEPFVQRSMDTLSVSNHDFHTIFGSGQRSVENLPAAPLTASLDGSGFQDSLFGGQTTNFVPDSNSPFVQDSNSPFAQDGNSPGDGGLSDNAAASQWPWGSNMTTFGYGSLSTSPSQDCLPNLENDWAISATDLSNPSWSAGDLPLDPNKLGDDLTQPISHSGDSQKLSNPGLTTSSPDLSDIGESALLLDLDLNNPPSAVGETLFWDDNPVFRPAVSASSTNLPAPTSAPTSVPTYVEDEQSAKGLVSIYTTAVSTGANNESPFPTAGFADTQAIAMPNIDDGLANDWFPDSSNNYFNGGNTFDGSYPTWS